MSVNKNITVDVGYILALDEARGVYFQVLGIPYDSAYKERLKAIVKHLITFLGFVEINGNPIDLSDVTVQDVFDSQYVDLFADN